MGKGSSARWSRPATGRQIAALKKQRNERLDVVLHEPALDGDVRSTLLHREFGKLLQLAPLRSERALVRVVGDIDADALQREATQTFVPAEGSERRRLARCCGPVKPSSVTLSCRTTGGGGRTCGVCTERTLFARNSRTTGTLSGRCSATTTAGER